MWHIKDYLEKKPRFWEICWIERRFEVDAASTSFDRAICVAHDIVDNNPFPRFAVIKNGWFMATFLR